ncbi:MAG: ABC transporter ATP-binding protein [Halobacteriota archaeon]
MLEVVDLRKSFGGLVAVAGVSFTVDPGELVGLIGPNGAGKTTLFNTISGLYQPDDGRVHFDGRDITGLRTSAICRAGLVRTFQIVRTFDESTVFENVLTGALFGSGSDLSIDEATEQAEEVLQFVGLEADRATHTSELPIAKRKLVELARGLACDPELLLIDEMGAGLTPAELDELVTTIERIRRDRGVAILWIEHVMAAILGSTDRVLVLHKGELISEGSPAAIEEDDRVVEAYLGDTV